MKIVLCVIIVFCSGFIGISVSSDYAKKLYFYKEFNAFLQFLKAKIAFSKDILSNCIIKFLNTEKLKNKQFFIDLKLLYEQTNLNNETFNNIVAAPLSDIEKAEIFNIVQELGTSDVLGQIELINNGLCILDKRIEELLIQKKTKGDIFAKLGICVGLLISILIY